MEYVQTVLVRIAADKLTDATGPDGVINALEAHRSDIRRRTGFLRMQITRSVEEGGDVLLSVETRWRDEESLANYQTSVPNAASIIREHGDEVVADSLQVRRMEALESEVEESKRGVVYERFAIAALVPLGIVGFGFAVIYSLSRIYLEIGNEWATVVAAIVALTILLGAWYFAANPGAMRIQLPAVGLTAAALLLAGGVYAQVNYEAEVHEVVDGEPTAEPPGGEFLLVMGDNFFEFNGERNPTITVGANVDITLPLVNEGSALHNVHIAATGSYESDFCSVGGENPCSDPARIPGGGEGTITFNLPPGTYDFRCDFHPVEMTGTIEVVEGGPTGPGAPPPPPAETPGAGALTIQMDDNVFLLGDEENPTISIAANTDVTIQLENVGQAIHNMHVAAGEDYESDFCSATGEDPCSDPPRVRGGESGTITVNLPPGTYDYRCDFHTVEMAGTFEVQ